MASVGCVEVLTLIEGTSSAADASSSLPFLRSSDRAEDLVRRCELSDKAKSVQCHNAASWASYDRTARCHVARESVPNRRATVQSSQATRYHTSRFPLCQT